MLLAVGSGRCDALLATAFSPFLPLGLRRLAERARAIQPFSAFCRCSAAVLPLANGGNRLFCRCSAAVREMASFLFRERLITSRCHTTIAKTPQTLLRCAPLTVFPRAVRACANGPRRSFILGGTAAPSSQTSQYIRSDASRIRARWSAAAGAGDSCRTRCCRGGTRPSKAHVHAA